MVKLQLWTNPVASLLLNCNQAVASHYRKSFTGYITNQLEPTQLQLLFLKKVVCASSPFSFSFSFFPLKKIYTSITL